jgi:hypothetical protein
MNCPNLIRPILSDLIYAATTCIFSEAEGSISRCEVQARHIQTLLCLLRNYSPEMLQEYCQVTIPELVADCQGVNTSLFEAHWVELQQQLVREKDYMESLAPERGLAQAITSMACPKAIADLLSEIIYIATLRIRGEFPNGSTWRCALHAGHIKDLPYLLKDYKADLLLHYYQIQIPSFVQEVEGVGISCFHPLWSQLAMYIEVQKFKSKFLKH